MLRSISSFPPPAQLRPQPAKSPVFKGRHCDSDAPSSSNFHPASSDQFSSSRPSSSAAPVFSFSSPLIGPPRNMPLGNAVGEAVEVVVQMPAGMTIEDLPPQLLQQIFLSASSHGMPMHRPNPALREAMHHLDFDRIGSLLNQGASLKPNAMGGYMSDVLLSMRPEAAAELVSGLKERNLISEQQLKRLLVKDIFSFVELSPQYRKELLQLANIAPTRLNSQVYQQVMQNREKHFKAPPNPNEQRLLEQVKPIWDGLSNRHKRMIEDAVQALANGNIHVVPDAFSYHQIANQSPMQQVMNFFSSPGLPARQTTITSVPDVTVDQIWSGAHFGAGLKTIPRLLGLMQCLEFMSQRPTKNYRWFTEGLSRGVPAYPVPDFNRNFPRGVKGIYSPDYIHKLGSNFTDDFSLAMSTLKQRNGDRININTLHNSDIGFTLDNGDGHDVACRIKFRRDLNSGKLNGQLTVIESNPKHIQQARRPGQDEAFKKLDTLVQAYFTSVLGWDQKDVPKMSTKVIYMNNQINGYCTSNAVDHLLAEDFNESLSVTRPNLPGWATTIQMPDKNAKAQSKQKQTEPEEFDTSNIVYFIKRTLDKLNQSRLILDMPDYQRMPNKDKRMFREGLAQVYGAMKMDQVNSVEGRVHDYHDTRLGNNAWRNMLAQAEQEFEQEPFWRHHFTNKNEYMSARIAESIITPVQIEDELRLMDTREVNYYRSREKVEEKLAQEKEKQIKEKNK